MQKTILITGGARSGKSRHAQSIAEAFDGQLVFIATGEACDAEMAGRIARHRADRGPRWQTIEAPIARANGSAAGSVADGWVEATPRIPATPDSGLPPLHPAKATTKAQAPMRSFIRTLEKNRWSP